VKTKGEKMKVINLPERLRDLAETLCGCQWNHPLCSPATCNEAADEIERLRAEIADAHALAYNSLPNRGDMEDTLCGQVQRLREEIERLQDYNEARYGIIELFLQAAGIEQLDSESVQEQIVRGIRRVERMRTFVFSSPVDLYRDSIRAAEAAKEK
jgi:hypothetical protein